ncbi:hypothetical protein LBMAG42_55040 [Deltaproteobacteria bacterium]|nr:hypothetical protein LBMAG42_55040 [Deltaproteobacteria bacterium]
MNTTTAHPEPLPPNVVADPWSTPPPLEGPSWARAASRHEAAAAAGEQRRSMMLTEQYGGERFAHAQHEYEEAVRRAELKALRQRMERLRDRQDRDRPLVRDAFLGFAAAFAPIALLVNGSQLGGTARKAAYLAGAAGAAYAAAEWMEHSHERRRAQTEDELDRCEVRAVAKGVPQPPPPRSVLSQLISGGS